MLRSPLYLAMHANRRFVIFASACAAAAALSGCGSNPTQSSTVIQPPTPPGLPPAPAIRVPNPPGVEPPEVGTVVRVERHGPPHYAATETPTSPQPSPHAVWVSGYYVWTGSQYLWQAGSWQVPPPGRKTWVSPSWRQEGNSYIFTEGYWR